MNGCNQYVTVWNRLKNPDDKQAPDIFYRKILPVKCKYKTKVTRNEAEGGVIVKVMQIAVIPYTECYKEPNEWAVLDDSERSSYFTLQDGDILALGAILYDITGITPWRETDVKEKLKPDVMTIKTVHNNTRCNQGRHWKVEGV